MTHYRVKALEELLGYQTSEYQKSVLFVFNQGYKRNREQIIAKLEAIKKSLSASEHLSEQQAADRLSFILDRKENIQLIDPSDNGKSLDMTNSFLEKADGIGLSYKTHVTNGFNGGPYYGHLKNVSEAIASQFLLIHGTLQTQADLAEPLKQEIKDLNANISKSQSYIKMYDSKAFIDSDETLGEVNDEIQKMESLSDGLESEIDCLETTNISLQDDINSLKTDHSPVFAGETELYDEHKRHGVVKKGISIPNSHKFIARPGLPIYDVKESGKIAVSEGTAGYFTNTWDKDSYTSTYVGPSHEYGWAQVKFYSIKCKTEACKGKISIKEGKISSNEQNIHNKRNNHKNTTVQLNNLRQTKINILSDLGNTAETMVEHHGESIRQNKLSLKLKKEQLKVCEEKITKAQEELTHHRPKSIMLRRLCRIMTNLVKEQCITDFMEIPSTYFVSTDSSKIFPTEKLVGQNKRNKGVPEGFHHGHVDQNIQNAAVTLFLYEKALNFQNWYHPEIGHYLLQMADNQARCIRVMFHDANEGNNTKTFKNQLLQLVMLSHWLKRPALFISKEPGADNHFICGLVKDGYLLLINPLGMTEQDTCYQTLAELKQEKTIKEVWISSNALQKRQYEAEGLVSCGPITLELATYVLTHFTPEELDIFWENHLKTEGHTTHDASGLAYYGINIENLLPETLKELTKATDKSSYENQVCSIRQKHCGQLQALPVEQAKNSDASVEGYLEKCKEAAPNQLVFNALITDRTLNDIDELSAYQLLKQELNLQPIKSIHTPKAKSISNENHKMLSQKDTTIAENAPKSGKIDSQILRKSPKNKNTGLFIDITLDFSKSSNNEQAEQILLEVQQHYNIGYTKIGIIYSANYQQTISINEHYENEIWITGTSGGNQADVICKVEKLLKNKYQDLCGKFRILPITTCEFSGGIGKVEDIWLEKDLNSIEKFLNEGGVVLGWKNQKSNKKKPYAIGGGVARQLTNEQNANIQGRLKSFKIDYMHKSSTSKSVDINQNKNTGNILSLQMNHIREVKPLSGTLLMTSDGHTLKILDVTNGQCLSTFPSSISKEYLFSNAHILENQLEKLFAARIDYFSDHGYKQPLTKSQILIFNQEGKCIYSFESYSGLRHKMISHFTKNLFILYNDSILQLISNDGSCIKEISFPPLNGSEKAIIHYAQSWFGIIIVYLGYPNMGTYIPQIKMLNEKGDCINTITLSNDIFFDNFDKNFQISDALFAISLFEKSNYKISQKIMFLKNDGMCLKTITSILPLPDAFKNSFQFLLPIAHDQFAIFTEYSNGDINWANKVFNQSSNSKYRVFNQNGDDVKTLTYSTSPALKKIISLSEGYFSALLYYPEEDFYLSYPESDERYDYIKKATLNIFESFNSTCITALSLDVPKYCIDIEIYTPGTLINNLFVIELNCKCVERVNKSDTRRYYINFMIIFKNTGEHLSTFSEENDGINYRPFKYYPLIKNRFGVCHGTSYQLYELIVLNEQGRHLFTTNISYEAPIIIKNQLLLWHKSDIKLFDLMSGNCLHVFSDHTGIIDEVILLPSFKFASSSREDRTTRIYDLMDGKCLKTFDELSGKLFVLPDDKLVVSSDDGIIRIIPLTMLTNIIPQSQIGKFSIFNNGKESQNRTTKPSTIMQESPLKIANTMSDHEVQLDGFAGLVSQNLQGPYAIKKVKQTWVFDWPKEHLKINQLDQNKVIKELLHVTGMNNEDSDILLDAMKKNTVENVLGNLNKKYPGIGETLGEGGFRISIESDAQYRKRIKKQVGALINCVNSSTGGANVLCFQEQPYKLKQDAQRQAIFKKIMEEYGYIEIATLNQRDVGIWVKQDIQKEFKKPDDKKLIEFVMSDPFRGCIIEGLGAVYLNLHTYTRGINNEEYINKLIELKTEVQKYAHSKHPQLSVYINGDLNLFQLKPGEINKLHNADFKVDFLRGQETFQNKSCEAYFSSAAPQQINQLQVRQVFEMSVAVEKAVGVQGKVVIEKVQSNNYTATQVYRCSFTSENGARLFVSFCETHKLHGRNNQPKTVQSDSEKQNCFLVYLTEEQYNTLEGLLTYRQKNFAF